MTLGGRRLSTPSATGTRRAALCPRLLTRPSSHAAAAVRDSADAQRLLGDDVAFGRWWDASVTVSRDGGVATAQFVLRGSRASADLRVGLARSRAAEAHWAGRLGSPLLATTLVRDAWTPLLIELTLPAERGRPDRLTLLPTAKPTAKPSIA